MHTEIKSTQIRPDDARRWGFATMGQSTIRRPARPQPTATLTPSCTWPQATAPVSATYARIAGQRDAFLQANYQRLIPPVTPGEAADASTPREAVWTHGSALPTSPTGSCWRRPGS